MVTTEVQVTNETSDSTSRPSTPAPSITPVLQTSHHHLNHHAPNSHTHPWMAPDDTVDLPAASTSRSSSNPFTTISSITSTQRGHTKDNSSGSSCLPIHTINLTSPHSSSSSSNPKPPAAPRKRTPKRFLRCASLHRAWRRFEAKMDSIDPIKVAYLRTSFIFAISILVTWTPSSINRVYSFAHPTRTSFGLNMASAVVLPLQGLWNALIFTATSWTPLKEEVAALRARWAAARGSQRLSGCGGAGGAGGALGDAGRWRSGFADQEGMGKSPRGMGNVRVIRGGSL